MTEGWALDASGSGCLTFNFHRYAPSDATDGASQAWKMDVIERE